MSDLFAIFSYQPRDLPLIGVIVAWTVGYGLFTLFLTPALFLRGRDVDLISDRTRAYAWFYHRLFGGLLMGAVAWLAIWWSGGTVAAYGWRLGRFDRAVAFVVVVLAVAIPAVIRRSRHADFRAHHPEIRIRRWTGRLLSNNRTTWFVYVAGYEFLLRGFVLFALVGIVGTLPALVLTVALDFAVHLKRPTVEAAAVIPMAIALGIGTLWTGSIIGPWLAHGVIIMTAETLARSTGQSTQSFGDL